MSYFLAITLPSNQRTEIRAHYRLGVELQIIQIHKYTKKKTLLRGQNP